MKKIMQAINEGLSLMQIEDDDNGFEKSKQIKNRLFDIDSLEPGDWVFINKNGEFLTIDTEDNIPIGKYICKTKTGFPLVIYAGDSRMLRTESSYAIDPPKCQLKICNINSSNGITASGRQLTKALIDCINTYGKPDNSNYIAFFEEFPYLYIANADEKRTLLFNVPDDMGDDIADKQVASFSINRG